MRAQSTNKTGHSFLSTPLYTTLFALFLGLSLSPSRSLANTKNTAALPKTTFLFSLDGWANRHLWDKRLSMPNIRRLARAGIWGDSRTIFPSMTWSSHASILTGQTPRKHGILANRWFHNFNTILIPSWDVVEHRRKSATLYDIAYHSQWRPAAVMWPGTQGSDTLSYNLPELTRPSLIRRYIPSNMKKIIRRAHIRSTKRLIRLMKQEGPSTDELAAKVTLQLIRLPQKNRPRLFLVHFLGLDHAQHSKGIDPSKNPALRYAARNIDRLVGQIIEETKKIGIFSNSTFAFASDHGFMQTKWAIDIRRLLIKAGLSKHRFVNSHKASKENVFALQNGQTAFIYLRKNLKLSQHRKLRNKTLAALKRCKHIKTIYSPSQYHTLGLPTPSEDKGSPDLIALSNPDSYFGSHSGKQLVTQTPATGFHGYLPSHPDMWTAFVAFGAGIKHNPKRTSIRNIDLAPTLAHLMRLKWPAPTEGKILSHWLTPRAKKAILDAQEKSQQQLLSQNNKKKNSDDSDDSDDS